MWLCRTLLQHTETFDAVGRRKRESALGADSSEETVGFGAEHFGELGEFAGGCGDLACVLAGFLGGLGDMNDGGGDFLHLRGGVLDGVGDLGGSAALIVDGAFDDAGDFLNLGDGLTDILQGGGGFVGGGLDGLDLSFDVQGGVGGLAGETFDFGGDHGESSPGGTCEGGFDGGVEGKKTGLGSDLTDEFDDTLDLAGGIGESDDGFIGEPGLSGGGVGDATGVFDLVVDGVDGSVRLRERIGDLFHVTGDGGSTLDGLIGLVRGLLGHGLESRGGGIEFGGGCCCGIDDVLDGEFEAVGEFSALAFGVDERVGFGGELVGGSVDEFRGAAKGAMKSPEENPAEEFFVAGECQSRSGLPDESVREIEEIVDGMKHFSQMSPDINSGDINSGDTGFEISGCGGPADGRRGGEEAVVLSELPLSGVQLVFEDQDDGIGGFSDGVRGSKNCGHLRRPSDRRSGSR